MFESILQNRYQLFAVLMTVVTLAISFISAAYWGKRIKDMKINPKTGRYELPKKQQQKKKK